MLLPPLPSSVRQHDGHQLAAAAPAAPAAATAQCDDQAADDVESGAEDECEPAPKRRKSSSVKSSTFVGVSWSKGNRRWEARIQHDGKMQPHLGSFDDEREAARAFDTAARRLRGEDAHDGRAGRKKWCRLNFPTEREVQRAAARGALLTEEDKAAAAAASERQGPSVFVGVSWHKDKRKWVAQLRHDGKRQNLGGFDDERAAARAVDTAARRLRGDEAHGGRSGGNNKWYQLNFPSKREAERAKALGMPAAAC